MALTLDQVRKIAELARLRLTPEEEARFAGQLGEVVDYVDRLQSYLGDERPELGSPIAMTDLRLPEATDTVAPCLPRESFLANAPAAIDGFLLVPLVSELRRGPGVETDA